MNNIIKLKELCEQELYFLYNYIDFCRDRSLFFVGDTEANSLILEYTSHRMNALNLVEKKKQFLHKVNQYISNHCDHEWVNDIIDIDVERSQNICYCIKCETNKE